MRVRFALSRSGWSLAAFVLLTVAACGGRESGTITGPSSGTTSGSATGTMNGASSGTSIVGTSGTTSGAVSGAVASGSVVGPSGTVATGSAGSAIGKATSGTMMSSGTSGARSGAVATLAADGGPDSGPLGKTSVPSAGCGKPWAGMTGMWVSQPTGCTQGVNNQGTSACQTIPPGSTVPATATQGSPENRGWWVYVPTGYDASKPYTVIYSRQGCDDANWFHAGADGYPYYDVDNGQAILVGLDYDTFSESPGCPDARDPESNDLVFMPWLMTQIENSFCVDTTREWFSEYADDASLAQQFNCAFPARLRGEVIVTGIEPGSPSDPYLNGPLKPSLPTCHPAPTAAFYVHDIDDTDDPYVSILPGCSRVLQQNGCSNTKCDPMDTTLTTPYPVPEGVNLTISNGTCVQFNGCPAEYPVVFCTTNYAPNHHDDDQRMGVVKLFWDFIQTGGRGCPAGQLYQDGTCATSCASPETVCGDTCFNLQTDSAHCGACGTACPAGQACSGGSCACPSGALMCGSTCVYSQSKSCACPDPDLVCNGLCVGIQTDPSNCGACGNICPTATPLCRSGVCSPN